VIKILLVYHFPGNFSLMGLEPLGLIQLGRLLRDRGHAVRYVTLERAALARALREFQPQVIAYSIASVHHGRALRINRELKREHNFYAVFGGPHPTFFPELIEEEGVDTICVGEADLSFPEWADRFEAQADFAQVPNFWVKTRAGEVVKNPPAPLVEDLDTLPFPDREGLYQNRGLRQYRMKSFIASRGCPFACTYCYNQLYRDLYRGRGRVWRTRSPEHLVGEIAWVKKNWPLAQLNMVDDVFVPSRSWLEKFVELYRSQINLPFACILRLDRVDEDQARLLAEAGCRVALAAIESGSERVRREVMGRRMSNEQILQGCEHLHRHGIKIYTQNMLGVPGETLEEALATVDLNLRARADLAITSLFTPFPSLALTQRAIAEGYYSGDVRELPHNMTSRSVLNLPDKMKIEKLQKLLPALVDLPVLRRYVHWLLKLPLHPLYSSLRNAWMAVKIYRDLGFRPNFHEHLEILRRGIKYIVWDR